MLRIEIERDPDPQDPTEWDSLGKIAYLAYSRYKLGTEALSQEQMREIEVGINDETLIGLPVYAYVHGDVSLSTEPHSCPWDSGLSGYIYCTAEMEEEEGDKDAVLALLKTEVEIYSLYLQGEVYGYRILVDDEEVDSCWGFYGRSYCEEAAREAAKSLEQNS